MDGTIGHDPIWDLRLAAAALAAIVIVAAAVILVSIHNGQVRGCERGKVTSAQQAKTAQARVVYLTRVLAAASVKEDVKAAATDALAQERAVAIRLTSVSRIDCHKVYPLVSL